MALILKQKLNMPALFRQALNLKDSDQCFYLKIIQIGGNSLHQSITVCCFPVSEETSIEEGQSPADNNVCIFNRSYSFVPDLDGSNFIQQGYEYLKTLPEFANCEDC